MNDTPHLEQYDWLRVWHDHPDLSPEEKANSKRILFIGDSITNGSFTKCKNFLLDEYKNYRSDFVCPTGILYFVSVPLAVYSSTL